MWALLLHTPILGYHEISATFYLLSFFFSDSTSKCVRISAHSLPVLVALHLIWRATFSQVTQHAPACIKERHNISFLLSKRSGYLVGSRRLYIPKEYSDAFFEFLYESVLFYHKLVCVHLHTFCYNTSLCEVSYMYSFDVNKT